MDIENNDSKISYDVEGSNEDDDNIELKITNSL